jgi:exosome complex RNA-binding protein Csl4
VLPARGHREGRGGLSGDRRSYFLTTAKNELGVVYARSVAAGVPMVPVGWEEMQCPQTLTVERRKLAKVAWRVARDGRCRPRGI